MFKKLFDELSVLVASAKVSGLFQAFHDDFYKADKDVIEHDMKIGDTWLFVIKDAGTRLVLNHAEHDEYLQCILSDALDHFQYFILSVGVDSVSVSRQSLSQVKTQLRKLQATGYRKPNREFAYNHITSRWPALHSTVLMSDLKFKKGEVVLFSSTNNSVSYVLPAASKTRSLPVPFSFDAPVGHFKLVVISDTGHATFEPVTAKVFSNALRKLKKAA